MGPPSYMQSVDRNVVMRCMTVDGIECLVLSPVHFTAQETSPQHPFDRPLGMCQDQSVCSTQVENYHFL